MWLNGKHRIITEKLPCLFLLVFKATDEARPNLPHDVIVPVRLILRSLHITIIIRLSFLALDKNDPINSSFSNTLVHWVRNTVSELNGSLKYRFSYVHKLEPHTMCIKLPLNKHIK